MALFIQLWRASMFPALVFSFIDSMNDVSFLKFAFHIQEYYPVFNDAYYELHVAGRTPGNIQESIMTPHTNRPESILVAIIRHYSSSKEIMARHLVKLLTLGADPDGITSDGPTWITPMVAAEMFIRDRDTRDLIQRMLFLAKADPNETGWCGKNVLHYRTIQYMRDPRTSTLTDLISWLNIPSVLATVPMFEWNPTLRVWNILDYIENHATASTAVMETIRQVFYCFDMPIREEDEERLPSLQDVMAHDGYFIYRERIACHWQLCWKHMSSEEWVDLLSKLRLWSCDDPGIEDFMGTTWSAVESNRRESLSGRFMVDSIDFNPPYKFPCSWTICINHAGREYQMWGGYLQILFRHPIHPQTGEHITASEINRLWEVHMTNVSSRLMIYWKREFILPDSLRGVMDRIKAYHYEHDILGAPVSVFMTHEDLFRDPVMRTEYNTRYVLDRITHWIRKIHPYGNFHHIMDHDKRTSPAFWKYMMQVLGHSPSSGATIMMIPVVMIRLSSFESWMQEHTTHSTTGVLRLCIHEEEDDPHSCTLHRLPMTTLILAFIKCTYLSIRSNLDAFHFRFEEEYAIIDFTEKSLNKFSPRQIVEQEDVFFTEFLEFFHNHSSNHPHATFSMVFKKVCSLTRILRRSEPRRPIRPSTSAD